MVSELQKGRSRFGRDNKTQGESDKINEECTVSGGEPRKREEEGEIGVAVSISEPERIERK